MWAVNSAQSNPRVAAVYVSFLVGCLYVYRMLEVRSPTGAYDHVLTLSACLQSLGFALLVLTTHQSVAEGLSEKSLWAFLVAHTTRLSTTWWGEGYTPEDNTADIFLYQIAEASGILFVGFQLLKLGAARASHDVGQGLERWHMLIGMCGVSLALAWFTKTSRGHNDFFADLSWMFSVWLDSVALFPQILLLKTVRLIDDSAVHFLVLSLAASLAFGGFWAKAALTFDTNFYYAIVSAAGVRMSLCGGCLYLFITSSRPGKGGQGGDVFGDQDML